MDTFLAVLLSVVQAAFCLAGGAVSLKQWSESSRRRFAVLFVCLAAAGIALTWRQASLAGRSGEETKKAALGDAERPPFVGVISLPGFTRFVTTNGSDYPAYGIRIQLYDDTTKGLLRNYDYAEMPAHAEFMDQKAWVPPNGAVERHFTAHITTRTGLVFEELILRRAENNQWMRASRVRRGMRTLGEDADSAWPRDQNGQIDWR